MEVVAKHGFIIGRRLECQILITWLDEVIEAAAARTCRLV